MMVSNKACRKSVMTTKIVTTMLRSPRTVRAGLGALNIELAVQTQCGSFDTVLVTKYHRPQNEIQTSVILLGGAME